MNTYRRKAAYQSDGVVEEYVHKFTDPIGRKEHDDTTVALTRALHSIPGVRIILDMPCGTGRYSSFLRKKGYLYVGADISMKMMEVLVEDQKEQGRTLPSLGRTPLFYRVEVPVEAGQRVFMPFAVPFLVTAPINGVETSELVAL